MNHYDMTKAQLQSVLTASGVAFPKKANHGKLVALAEQHIGAESDLPEGDIPTPESGETAAPPAPTPAATPAPAEGTGLKIEKDRPEQNGIKRPSIGGKCRAIWDALDAYRTETGELPTSKTVKELAADEGWNPNNASIEYYQWRKYNGITKSK